MIDTTFCPECGETAEVLDRHVLESTDGPVEHLRIRCLRRHWFLLPASMLAPAEHEPPAPREAVPRPVRGSARPQA